MLFVLLKTMHKVATLVDAIQVQVVFYFISNFGHFSI